MQFLEQSRNDRICFALTGSKRVFLAISNLTNIRSKFPRGLDALQLFKIPSRKFEHAFYMCELTVSGKGQANSIRYTKKAFDGDQEVEISEEKNEVRGQLKKMVW